jgi:hypothetical protein
MFIGTEGMMGGSGMMSGWGMGLGMLVIVALIFGAGLAVGYILGARR